MASHSLAILDRLEPEVPAALVERAERWAAGGVSVAAVLSASVILLRDGAAGLETYLLHRHARMAFAASMAVFPGGKVDPADASGHFDAIRVCALRETLEETGVALEDSALLPWAHWITPEMEPRRYDTTFFVAALPPEQTATDISGETEHAEWIRPCDALAAYRSGAVALMPPTLSILLEVNDLASVAEVAERAQDRVVATVLPRLQRTAEGGWRFGYPRSGGGEAP